MPVMRLAKAPPQGRQSRRWDEGAACSRFEGGRWVGFDGGDGEAEEREEDLGLAHA